MSVRRPTTVWFVLCIAALACTRCSAPPGAGANAHATGENARNSTPDEAAAADPALASFDRGELQRAASRWDDLAQQYHRHREYGRQVEAMVNLAAAYRMLGQQDMALQQLGQAVTLARSLNDRPRTALALSALGEASTYSRQAESAGPALAEALALARATGQTRLEAVVHNNMGNLRAAQGDFENAEQHYDRSATLAKQAGDEAQAAQAAVNHAWSAQADGRHARAAELANDAADALRAVADSHDKTLALLTVAQVMSDAAVHLPDQREKLLREARRNAEEALGVARRLGDRRAEGDALGGLGHLDELAGRFDDALRLTRQAAFIAQEVQSPDALYRWRWQAGRLLRAQGHLTDALDAYRRALATLQGLRHDIAIGFGNRNLRSSFRQAVGPLYLETADLLFRRADDEPDAARQQPWLLEARQTLESLKSAELTDYFQDDCINQLRSRIEQFVQVDPRTAVVYLAPMPDRTEILLSLSDSLRRFRSPVGADELERHVQEFRRRLEVRTTHRYIDEARRLYDWLIRPIEPTLTGLQIDTLVFVPDGALRTIPMAALHDGERFLIERFAVAVTPGLSLMEPRPLGERSPRLLMAGLSESVQGFAPLPHVRAELSQLQDEYGGVKLMDREFVRPAFARQVRQQPFGIVHIASHGQFKDDARQSFILAYDGKLTLDDLERTIRPSRYRGRPVELLTLSACQTAAGDDRAALGLAGIAVKAGARSALATLWTVNDDATSILIGRFYANLRRPDTSKARALRGAQVSLLRDPRYRHPFYWSPFLIIGNWL
jgi:CHAT domain-containing protein